MPGSAKGAQATEERPAPPRPTGRPGSDFVYGRPGSMLPTLHPACLKALLVLPPPEHGISSRHPTGNHDHCPSTDECRHCARNGPSIPHFRPPPLESSACHLLAILVGNLLRWLVDGSGADRSAPLHIQLIGTKRG